MHSRKPFITITVALGALLFGAPALASVARSAPSAHPTPTRPADRATLGPRLTGHRLNRPLAVRAMAARPSAGVVSIALPVDGVNDFPTTEFAAFGSVWILTQGNFSTLQRLDPQTNRLTGAVPLGYGDTSGNDSGEGAIAAVDGSLWVAEYFYNTVLRIDPVRLAVTHTIKVGRSPSGVVAAAGSIFVSDSHASAVSRINPRTNRVVATIPVGDPDDFNGGPLYLTYTAGQVWTIVPAQQRLYAIDPRTDRVVARPSVAPAFACGRLDPVPGAIWIDDQNCSNTFARYDLATGHVTQIQEPSNMCLLGIAVLHGRLYSDDMAFDPSTGCTPGSFVPRDLTTGAVLGAGTPIDVVGFEVVGLRGSLWTNDFSTGNHVLRITPERTS